MRCCIRGDKAITGREDISSNLNGNKSDQKNVMLDRKITRSPGWMVFMKLTI